jgi:hypothetical protein
VINGDTDWQALRLIMAQPRIIKEALDDCPYRIASIDVHDLSLFADALVRTAAEWVKQHRIVVEDVNPEHPKANV